MPLCSRYHWVVAFCCFLLMFCNVGLLSTSFSVYQPYLIALPGMGDTAGSVVVAVRNLVALVCMFAVVRYYQMLDCRKGSFVASLFTTASLVLFGLAQSFPMLCLAAGIGGIGYGLGGMVCVTYLVNRWFRTDVGTAVGIAAVGSGVASIVVPLCAEWVINALSLSASFWAEAALALVIGCVNYALMRDKPEEMGLSPYVGEKWMQEQREQASGGDAASVIPADEGVSLPAVSKALFTVAAGIVGGVCIAATTFLSVLVVSEGYTHAFAAVVLSVSGLVLTASKFAMGRLLDVCGGMWGSAIAFVSMAFGLVLLCLGSTGEVAFVWVGAVVYSFGLAIGSTGIPVWSIHFSTPEERVKTVRTFQLGYASGGLLLTMLPGPLKDLSGTYVSSFLVLAALTVVAMIIVTATYRRYRS